jgi:hypothetical protein
MKKSQTRPSSASSSSDASSPSSTANFIAKPWLFWALGLPILLALMGVYFYFPTKFLWLSPASSLFLLMVIYLLRPSIAGQRLVMKSPLPLGSSKHQTTTSPLPLAGEGGRRPGEGSFWPYCAKIFTLQATIFFLFVSFTWALIQFYGVSYNKPLALLIHPLTNGLFPFSLYLLLTLVFAQAVTRRYPMNFAFLFRGFRRYFRHFPILMSGFTRGEAFIFLVFIIFLHAIILINPWARLWHVDLKPGYELLHLVMFGCLSWLTRSAAFKDRLLKAVHRPQSLFYTLLCLVGHMLFVCYGLQAVVTFFDSKSTQLAMLHISRPPFAAEFSSTALFIILFAATLSFARLFADRLAKLSDGRKVGEIILASLIFPLVWLMLDEYNARLHILGWVTLTSGTPRLCYLFSLLSLALILAYFYLKPATARVLLCAELDGTEEISAHRLFRLCGGILLLVIVFLTGADMPAILFAGLGAVLWLLYVLGLFGWTYQQTRKKIRLPS